MLDKTKAAELFGVSGKNIQKFELKTPEGNNLKGWICKSRGSNMGSLIIDTMNNTPTWQFVRGMPKLKYLDDRDVVSLPYVFHKEDGTNIVMYPLLGKDGELIETCFKTRLMPGCNDNWMVKINEIITPNYFKAIEKEKISFSYELYGTQNGHEVRYDLQDIDLRLELLTVLEQGRSYPAKDMLKLSQRYDLPEVMMAFDVCYINDKYLAVCNELFMERFFDYLPSQVETPELHDTTLEGLYKQMELFFEKMNIRFQEKHGGGIITEGSVWHYGDEENHMAKCKAISVREGHMKQACGIPHHDIKKAIQKAEENYDGNLEDADREWVFDFVKEELLEEYEPVMVDDNRTKQKTFSILGKYLHKVQVDANLLEIVTKLNEECGYDASPADKMRCFSELYPDMRKQNRKVYGAIVGM